MVTIKKVKLKSFIHQGTLKLYWYHQCILHCVQRMLCVFDFGIKEFILIGRLLKVEI